MLQRSFSNTFVDVCLYLLPQYILYENVANLIAHDHGLVLQKILARLLASDYQVRFAILRAAAHGVPQKRRR